MQVFLSQLTLGLVNGSFYAMLSLGLAVIFGLLGIVNFAHGALYMLGAYVAFIGMDKLGINYWAALIVAPIVIGALGVAIERLFLRHLYKIDPIYGLLLTFGLALIAEGVLRYFFGVSGQSYDEARAARRLDRPRLHGPADLPRLGRRRLADDLPRHLVPDRAHQPRRDPARRHREPGAGAGVRHQRAADGDAHLRRRRRPGGDRRRARGADHPGDAADGVEPDHRRLRRRRHRRHGIDPRLDPHRPGARPGRRA